jgi:hypothetical protein
MKRYCLFTIFLLVLIACGIDSAAQTDTAGPRITADFRNMPMEKFLLDLEQRTGYRFYFDPAHFDSAQVDMAVTDQTLFQVLRLAFAHTRLVFAQDRQKNIFVSRNTAVKTTLADNLMDDPAPKTNTAPNPSQAAAKDTVTEEKDEQAATLENKLYTIGARPRGNLPPGHAIITGYLRDAKTGEPVIGASVLLANSKTGAISDQYGYYSLSVPRGRNTISIQSLGIRDTRRQLMVYTDGRMNIDLQPQVTALRNVTVSSEKSSQIRGMTMGVQKIDIKAIKQVPVAFGEADVLKVVLTMPGVKSVGEASTGLNVRGGASDQNLILFNDATVFNPSHFFGMFSAFNPELVKDVQLYKSVIPAKYGGRLSSVLEVNSREGNKKELAGSAGIGLLTSRINIEGPLVKEKSSFIFGARTTYADWLLTLLPAEYKNSKAGFYDINLNLSHEINKKNNLYFTGYLSRDRFSLNNDTSYSYGNQNLSVKWKHVINNKWYAVVAGGYDRYNYSITSDANPTNAYKLGFDINQVYGKLNVNYYVNSKQTIDFGVSSILYKLHPGKYVPLGDKSLVKLNEVNGEQALETAVFLGDKYSFTPDFSMEGAVRYVLYSNLGPGTVNHYTPGIPKTESNRIGTTTYGKGETIKTYGGPEFRISARYLLGDNFSVKLGYNTQRQYIHVLSNTAAIAPTDIWKLSDANIAPQYGDQISLGLYHNFKSNTIETSLEVYYKNIKNYLDYKSGARLVLNPSIEADVLSTHGKAYGLEVLLKKTTGKFNGWVSYTYSRTLLRMNDTTQGNLINKGNYYPANYDKPHDLTFVGNYRVSHRFSLSVNTTYSTGRPITLPIGRYYYAGAQRTLYSDRNIYRIPSYFRMDFSVNIEGNHKVNQRFHNSFSIGVYNLTATKNPYSVYYATENGLVNGYKLSIFGTAIPYINYNVRF